MALAVTYSQVSDWFSTASPKTASASWAVGDIVVVIGGVEGNSTGPGTPSGTGLSFTLQASSPGTGAESGVYLWSSTVSTGSTGNISCTGPSLHWGFGVWVVSGSPSGVANAAANTTESNPSLTVGAGSVVIFGIMDWNATNPPGKTPATGSGTATERRDSGNGTTYAQWLADWVGTSATTTTFGPNNYTSLKVAKAYIEVTAPVAAATSGLWRRRPSGLLMR